MKNRVIIGLLVFFTFIVNTGATLATAVIPTRMVDVSLVRSPANMYRISQSRINVPRYLTVKEMYYLRELSVAPLTLQATKTLVTPFEPADYSLPPTQVYLNHSQFAPMDLERFTAPIDGVLDDHPSPILITTPLIRN